MIVSRDTVARALADAVRRGLRGDAAVQAVANQLGVAPEAVSEVAASMAAAAPA